MEGSLYLPLGAAIPRTQRRSRVPQQFYLRAAGGNPPPPHRRAGAGPGYRWWGSLPPRPPRGQATAPPAGEQTGHSAAARGCQGASPREIRRGVGPDRLQKPPSRRPRRTRYLAAGAGRDAAVSCRPWGARAPASRSACFWPPRSWPGRRPQRGNAPTLPFPSPGPRTAPPLSALFLGAQAFSAPGPPRGAARPPLPCLPEV